MGTRPCVVTADVPILWDGVTQRLPKGQVMDVPPDSALEAEIGLQNLATLSGVPLAAPEPAMPEKAAQDEPEAAAEAGSGRTRKAAAKESGGSGDAP